MKIGNVLLAIKNGSFTHKIKEKIFLHVLSNNVTYNRLMEDISYKDISKKFSSKLDELVDKYSDCGQMTYSDKVWVLWRQGYENAPEMVKACFDSIKNHLKDREIVFLTSNNLTNYITLPEYIEDKHKKGIIQEAAYSDIIRISLLAEHGGLWVDSTVFCTGKGMADRFKELPFFVYKAVDLDRTEEISIVCSNWLISSYTNNPYVLVLRDMIYYYWEKTDYLKQYFIFHIFMHMVKNEFETEWAAIPSYNNVSPHMLGFEILEKYDDERYEELKKMSDFHKLNRHAVEGLQDGFCDSFYGKIISREIM